MPDPFDRVTLKHFGQNTDASGVRRYEHAQLPGDDLPEEPISTQTIAHSLAKAGQFLNEFADSRACAGQFSENGKKASAGRGFQHDVRRRDRGSDIGDECQPDRR
jgi:hypothetical protein